MVLYAKPFGWKGNGKAYAIGLARLHREHFNLNICYIKALLVFLIEGPESDYTNDLNIFFRISEIFSAWKFGGGIRL